MKITVVASMVFSKEMINAKKKLESLGYIVTIPEGSESHVKNSSLKNYEDTNPKVKGDLIRSYYKKIEDSDALLVLNYDKNGIANYVGGNVFLEMAFACVLKKPIFLLNPIPSLSYTSELQAMEPVILNGDLRKIKILN